MKPVENVTLVVCALAVCGCAPTAGTTKGAETASEPARGAVAANRRPQVEAPDPDEIPQVLRRTSAGGLATTPAFRNAGLAEPGAAADAVSGLEVYVFSIGQANSTLFVGPAPEKRTLLIDVGEVNWNTANACSIVRDRISDITGKSGVDYLVLTHHHMDHVGHPGTPQNNGEFGRGGGAFCLLNDDEEFTVGTLIDPSDAITAWRSDENVIRPQIRAQTPGWISTGRLGSSVHPELGPGQIDLGSGVTVEIVAADGRVFAGDQGMHELVRQQHGDVFHANGIKGASPNDFSIALEVSVGDFEVFTAGDLTGAPGEPPYDDFFETEHNEIYTNVESHLVKHWTSVGRESDVEVYMANHHGSANSSTKDLADALQPELVIYSCGGKYGHPNEAVVDRFPAAAQLVTTEWDDDGWPEGFPDIGQGWVNPVGEIAISVSRNGTSYTVSAGGESVQYPSLSDAQEQN